MNLVPFLIYIVCMFWDLDGPYWVLEDFAPDPKYRTIPTIIIFIFIRTFLLLPGFLETTRTIMYTSIGYLCAITYIKAMIEVLHYKVKKPTIFFKLYSELYILANVLSTGFQRSSFVCISIFYFLFIQTLWICICGLVHLNILIYLFFVSFALIIVIGVGVFLPIVTRTGEIISDLPRKKLNQMKNIHCLSKTLETKIQIKKAVALQPIKFSYGNYYPMGRKFSRNIFDNGVQNLLSMVLLFDLSGKRH